MVLFEVEEAIAQESELGKKAANLVSNGASPPNDDVPAANASSQDPRRSSGVIPHMVPLSAAESQPASRRDAGTSA